MMKKVMKLKTSEAKGQVLDYLVAKAIGKTIYRSKTGRWMTANYGEFNHRHGTPWFEPTISWKYGGHLIEREEIALEPMTHDKFGDGWLATRVEGPAVCMEFGPTPLIAVMRCYVVGILGDEVEVPDELKGGEL
jgi:hypothetical protein